MMQSLLGTILTVLALCVAAAFVVAYFFANVKKAKDDVLRATNQDLITRVELLEREKAVLETKVESQQKQLDVLKDLATGASATEKLRIDLLAFFEKHEREAHERYVLLIESQDKVAEAIGRFTSAVVEVQRGAKNG